jgi:hypothetical protein
MSQEDRQNDGRNPMKTLAEKIAVMQAAERGEQIRFRCRKDKKIIWMTIDNLQTVMWDWYGYDYDIAPKVPRKFWAVITWYDEEKTDMRNSIIFQHEEAALQFADKYNFSDDIYKEVFQIEEIL